MSSGVRKAMVLAAGHGRRLRPLTARTAKPAVPILGRPMIEYILRRLARDGIENVVVNLHHSAISVEPSLESAPQSVSIHRLIEENLLGTAGGLKNASTHFASEKAFLLMNSDTLVDFDLDGLARVHESSGGLATLLLRPKPSGSSYSSVVVADDGRIDAVVKGRSDGDWMFAGVWLLDPAVLDYLSGEPAGLEKELLPRLIDERRAFACTEPSTWITIDTPRRYWGACLTMAKEKLFEQDWNVVPTNGRRAATVLMGEGTTISRTATCRGAVVLGANCRVEKGAHLENVVTWDNVTVPRSARLVNCILANDVSLEPSTELEDKLVMSVNGDPTGLRKKEIRSGLLITELPVERSAGL